MKNDWIMAGVWWLMVVGEKQNLAGFFDSSSAWIWRSEYAGDTNWSCIATAFFPLALAFWASVNVADKIVVELFCTQMIAIDKFINLGKRLHFIWCQKCCDNLCQLFILPFWMFFLSTPPNQTDLVIHFYLHFTYDWYLLSLNNWNRYSCE